jgi:hypothetical protein
MSFQESELTFLMEKSGQESDCSSCVSLHLQLIVDFTVLQEMRALVSKNA